MRLYTLLAIKEGTRAKCFLASLYCLQAENGTVNSMLPPTEDGAIDDGEEDGYDTAHGMDIEQGNQVRLLAFSQEPGLLCFDAMCTCV